MPQLIEVPGMGQVEFPDDMTDDQIVEAIKKNMQPAATQAQTKPVPVAAKPAPHSVPWFAEQATEEVPWAPDPKMMSGITRGLAQGALFNYADELTALLGGDTERFRREQEQFRKEHPIISTGTELAGGLATGVLTPSLAAAHFAKPLLTGAAGRVAPLVAPSVVGATSGAVSGYGEGETPEERLEKAKTGAIFGAVATPAVQLASKVVSGPVKSIAGFFSRSAAEKGGVSKLASAMKEEGLDPNEIARQVAEATQKTGKPVMWVDMIDPDKYPKTYDLVSKGLTQGTSTEPKMKVLERAEGAAGRIVGDIQKGVHKRGEMSYEDILKSRGKRSTDWKTTFEQIRGTPVHSPEVSEILKDPGAREAVREGLKLARTAKGEGGELDLIQKHFVENPKTGELEVVGVPTIELIQSIKNIAYNPQLGKMRQGDPKAFALYEQQKRLMEAVKKEVPEYRKLAKDYADESDLLNAREFGAGLQSALSKQGKGAGEGIKGFESEKIIDMYKKMNKPEKDAFLQGLASTLTKNVRTEAGKVSGAKYASVVGEPTEEAGAKLRQLRSILGNTKRFKTLIEGLKQEKTIEKLGREFSGRPAVEFGAAPGQGAADFLKVAGATAIGHPGAAVPTFAGRAKAFLSGQTPKAMQPIGTLATQQAGSVDPLIALLGKRYGKELGDFGIEDLMTPSLIAGAGQTMSPNFEFKRGGLAQYRGGGAYFK